MGKLNKEKLKTLNSKIKRKINKFIQAVSSLVFLSLAGYLYVNNPDFLKTEDKKISCRIGITTDLKRRKQEWTNDYLEKGIVIKKWTVLSVHKSKSSAQEVETREAKKQNCIAHPGGRNSDKALWYVYKAEF